VLLARVRREGPKLSYFTYFLNKWKQHKLHFKLRRGTFSNTKLLFLIQRKLHHLQTLSCGNLDQCVDGSVEKTEENIYILEMLWRRLQSFFHSTLLCCKPTKASSIVTMSMLKRPKNNTSRSLSVSFYMVYILPLVI
jgi:hypothetical protein